MNIPGLPPFDADHQQWNMDYKYRLGYVSSKYRIARRYIPNRICEIGVYSGIAAHCFLAASPYAFYLGIDNKRDEIANGTSIVEPAYRSLLDLGYNAKLLIADSQELTKLPDGPFDFIHIDGNHQPLAAQHDTHLAWRHLTDDGVLVIDDCHNFDVVFGVTAALYMQTDLINWSYIDDGVGTMIIHKEPRVR